MVEKDFLLPAYSSAKIFIRCGKKNVVATLGMGFLGSGDGVGQVPGSSAWREEVTDATGHSTESE